MVPLRERRAEIPCAAMYHGLLRPRNSRRAPAPAPVPGASVRGGTCRLLILEIDHATRWACHILLEKGDVKNHEMMHGLAKHSDAHKKEVTFIDQAKDRTYR